MSVWKCATSNLSAGTLHAHRCSLLNEANPVCRRPFSTKRALGCHGRTPAWHRCCKRKTAVRARKAAEDGDDVKVTTQFLQCFAHFFNEFGSPTLRDTLQAAGEWAALAYEGKDEEKVAADLQQKLNAVSNPLNLVGHLYALASSSKQMQADVSHADLQ